MPFDNKIAGALAIIAAAQFLAVMLYAESVVPGFDRAQNFISDLGLGPTSTMFNSSLIFSGILILAVAALAYRIFGNPIFALAMLGLAFSIIGIGIFPEDVYPQHFIASYFTFVLGPMVAIGSSWFAKKPWKYIFAALGIFSMAMTTLFISETTFGMGIGILERLIVYPFLFWGIAFGAYLFKYGKSASG